MTVKLVVRKVPNDPKKGYLFIRLTKDRKSRYESLGIKITKKNLKKDGESVSSLEPNYREINKKIKERLNHYRFIDSEMPMTKRHEVIPFMEKIIENHTLSEGTKQQRKSTLAKFREFVVHIDKEDITFHDIDYMFLDAFKNFMDKPPHKKGLAQNTVRTYLQVFSKFIDYAKKDRSINLPKDYDPFHDFKLPQKIQPKNKSLTIDEVRVFAQAKWKKERYRIYQDMFLFQLYGGGLRVSDVLTIRWGNFYVDDDINLDFIMYKTKRQLDLNIYDGIQYLKLCIGRYYPDFIEDLNKLNKEKEDLERKLVQRNFEVEEGLYMNKKEEEQLILLRSLTEGKINIVKNKILDLFKKYIRELSNNYPEQFVFPFMWDYENNVPYIDLDKKYNSHEEYLKLVAEKSRYHLVLKRMQEKLDIKTNISSHVARHTYTQLLLENNVNIHYLSKSLGHSSLSITESYRRRLSNKESKSIVKLLPKI